MGKAKSYNELFMKSGLLSLCALGLTSHIWKKNDTMLKVLLKCIDEFPINRKIIIELPRLIEFFSCLGQENSFNSMIKIPFNLNPMKFVLHPC